MASSLSLQGNPYPISFANVNVLHNFNGKNLDGTSTLSGMLISGKLISNAGLIPSNFLINIKTSIHGEGLEVSEKIYEINTTHIWIPSLFEQLVFIKIENFSIQQAIKTRFNKFMYFNLQLIASSSHTTSCRSTTLFDFDCSVGIFGESSGFGKKSSSHFTPSLRTIDIKPKEKQSNTPPVNSAAKRDSSHLSFPAQKGSLNHSNSSKGLASRQANSHKPKHLRSKLIWIGLFFSIVMPSIYTYSPQGRLEIQRIRQQELERQQAEQEKIRAGEALARQQELKTQREELAIVEEQQTLAALSFTLENNLRYTKITASCGPLSRKKLVTKAIVVPLNKSVIDASINYQAASLRLNEDERKSLLEESYRHLLESNTASYIIILSNNPDLDSSQDSLRFKNFPEDIKLNFNNSDYNLINYTGNLEANLNPGWNTGYLHFENYRRDYSGLINAPSIRFRNYSMTCNNKEATSHEWAILFDESDTNFLALVQKGLTADEIRNKFIVNPLETIRLTQQDIDNLIKLTLDAISSGL